MNEHMVRLSFDVPEEEHCLLKTGCAQLKIAIRDFLHEMMLKLLELIEFFGKYGPGKKRITILEICPHP